MYIDIFICAPVCSHRSHKENFCTVHKFYGTGETDLFVSNAGDEFVTIFSIFPFNMASLDMQKESDSNTNNL